ncbi:CmpA/NrtA family ABC transporter substrate-binding protein [Colwellia sp. MEBiC06753]
MTLMPFQDMSSQNMPAQKFAIEKSTLAIGFIPLTDCAPLVIAQENGYFAEQGLSVSLHKQFSWATLRDKLHIGALDAVECLAPMPLASTLGLTGEPVNVIAPMVLSQNGNGITVSLALFDEIQQLNLTTALTFPLAAKWLIPVIEQRKRIGEKLKFATVYPHSCHYYQLMSWLTQSGISKEDVDIVIIPPASMVDALQSGDIDGFCVGGPWNAKAVRDGIGVTGITSCDVWPDMPEKVLAVTQSWQQQYPETTKALIVALQKACNWLIDVANRFEAARLLSREQYLGVELSVIGPSLIGSCLVHHQMSPRSIPRYNRFAVLLEQSLAQTNEQSINRPTVKQGSWLLSQMIEFGHNGQLESYEKTDLASIVDQVFREDIYQSAKQVMLE